MRNICLLLLLIVGLSDLGVFAQDCGTEASIPDSNKKIGSGTATAHYEGVTSIKGGQAVYVKITNANALGVSYILAIEEDAKPTVSNCTYKALLVPKGSVILSGAVFGEPPIAWKIRVAVGPESDAGVLGYEVYSTAK
jgi:hypothetical protein